MRWLSFLGAPKSMRQPEEDRTQSNDSDSHESTLDSALGAIPTLDYIGSACQLVLGYSGKHTDGYSGYYWNGEG